MAKVIAFYWDNSGGKEHNGRSLIIGQHLPNKTDDHPEKFVSLYGLSIDVSDLTKEFQLKDKSCFVGNMKSDAFEVDKEKALELIMTEVKKSLDTMFDEREQETVENVKNK